MSPPAPRTTRPSICRSTSPSVKTRRTATTTYNGLKEYIGEPKTAERTTNVDSAAYSKYTVENGELYFVIARIEDTVLYGTGKLAQRNKMDELLSAIQY